MRDVLDSLVELLGNGESCALAIVVRSWQSSPRPPGAAMLIAESGEVVGSVSGGCVEAAVYEIARSVLETGRPATENFGVSDGDAFAAGLTCGGEIDVFIRRVVPDELASFAELKRSIANSEPVAMITIISSPAAELGRQIVVLQDRVVGSLGSRRLDETVAADGRGRLGSGATAATEYGAEGERLGVGLRAFTISFAPPPDLYIFGAVDFAAALATIGKFLGFRVTVCDARAVFATLKRFPAADEVVVDWPDRWLASQKISENTAICVLTHDPKFDIPALKVALASPARYVGAMGSRRTHEDRIDRLKQAGVSEPELDRLRSPIGLDLGSRTPEETAVSIAAEILQDRWGGSGAQLRTIAEPIHRGRTL
ncbi:MAG: XdhC family protein [Actinobacteria bacterium]|nr:XdhC family protein [Actinomycetota bacterium]